MPVEENSDSWDGQEIPEAHQDLYALTEHQLLLERVSQRILVLEALGKDAVEYLEQSAGGHRSVGEAYYVVALLCQLVPAHRLSQWFCTHNLALDATPLKALCDGHFDDVMRAARYFALQV